MNRAMINRQGILFPKESKEPVSMWPEKQKRERERSDNWDKKGNYWHFSSGCCLQKEYNDNLIFYIT